MGHKNDSSKSCSKTNYSKKDYTTDLTKIDKWNSGYYWHRRDFTQDPYQVMASQEVKIQAYPAPTTNGQIFLAPGNIIDPQLIPISNPVAGPFSQDLTFTITGTTVTTSTITFTVASTTGLVAADILNVTGFTSNLFLNCCFPAFGSTLTLTPTAISFPNVFDFLPSVNSDIATIKVAKPSGNFFTEELWFTGQGFNYNDDPILKIDPYLLMVNILIPLVWYFIKIQLFLLVLIQELMLIRLQSQHYQMD